MITANQRVDAGRQELRIITLHPLTLWRRTVLVLIAVCCASLPNAGHARAASKAVEKLRVAGLNQPVEILRDRWGINHIYAKNEHDLFFAQGYSVARDRLFQLELWRRQATGTLAEILGRRQLKRDLGARLHMFRGNLRQELNWYHPHGEQIVNAFVSGINAYIDQALADASGLPPEFKLLGIKPGKWTSAVVISRHNGLLSNAAEELQLAQAARILGIGTVSELYQFYGNPVLEIDPAVNLSLINGRILELYNAFRQPIDFTPQDVAGAYRSNESEFEDLKRGLLAGRFTTVEEDIGSNNWIVSGRLTQSGRPMLANDPHRLQGVPSLRYWVHLVAPGWNVIGSGEPVLPGVSIGHNQSGAWGLTIFGTDTEDLYVYDTNPSDPSQYRYRGEWENMRVVKDSIPVKGESPVTVELKYTRHGPVLYLDQEHNRAYALRAAWMEVGSAPYLASLRMDQARNWEEFRDACSYSRIPAENMVWADVGRTIGYQAVAIAPIRPNWSGLFPVPGDGRYEWDGFLPIKALPHIVNPENGYYVTANNYQFPPDYPFRTAQHWTAAEPYRAARITEFLASGRLLSVAEMMQLQHDNLSLPARALVPMLRDVVIAEPDVSKARDSLLTWDDILDKDSIAAALYEMWQRRVLTNMRDLFVPEDARDLLTSLSMIKVIDRLQAPDGRFGEDPVRGREELLIRSLAEAVAQLRKTLGPDMSRWRYGQEKYHHVLINHPLAAALKAEIRSQFNVGPAPRGGDSYTVTATGSTDNQTAGASFRMVVDIGGWDNSVGSNNPGQSGDPRSPHYRDLFDLWSRGKYFPVFYSRSKIESVTEQSIILEPHP